MHPCCIFLIGDSSNAIGEFILWTLRSKVKNSAQTNTNVSTGLSKEKVQVKKWLVSELLNVIILRSKVTNFIDLQIFLVKYWRYEKLFNTKQNFLFSKKVLRNFDPPSTFIIFCLQSEYFQNINVQAFSNFNNFSFCTHKLTCIFDSRRQFKIADDSSLYFYKHP